MPVIDDKIVHESYYSPVCSNCVNLSDPTIQVCTAFPNKIPDKIWSGKNKHISHVSGDNNILFKKLTAENTKQRIENSKDIS
jgi:hypothetical protein